MSPRNINRFEQAQSSELPTCRNEDFCEPWNAHELEKALGRFGEDNGSKRMRGANLWPPNARSNRAKLYQLWPLWYLFLVRRDEAVAEASIEPCSDCLTELMGKRKGYQRTIQAWPSMAKLWRDDGKFGGSSASVQSFFCKTCSVWAMFSCSDRCLTSKESDGSNLDRGYLGFPNLKLQACVPVCPTVSSRLMFAQVASRSA